MFIFFFFNDTATTEIYTLSLHDALPICPAPRHQPAEGGAESHRGGVCVPGRRARDRAHGLGSQRSRGARPDHLRRPRAPLLGHPRVRHGAGSDPRFPHVLLAAPVMTTLSLARMLRSAGISAPRSAAAGRSPLLAPRWYAHGFNRPVVYRAAGIAAAALPRRARLRLAVAIPAG